MTRRPTTVACWPATLPCTLSRKDGAFHSLESHSPAPAHQVVEATSSQPRPPPRCRSAVLSRRPSAGHTKHASRCHVSRWARRWLRAAGACVRERSRLEAGRACAPPFEPCSMRGRPRERRRPGARAAALRMSRHSAADDTRARARRVAPRARPTTQRKSHSGGARSGRATAHRSAREGRARMWLGGTDATEG